MWSLAFLHPSDIPNAFDQLKDSLPYDIQNYFEENYGKVRRKFRNGIVSRYCFHHHFGQYISIMKTIFQGHKTNSKHGTKDGKY